MSDFYGSAASVRTRTGVKARDLGIDSEDDLDIFIEEVLVEVSDLMDRVMRQTYLGDDAVETPVPAGLTGVANDAAGDAIQNMVVRRQAPVVRIDDFVVRQIQSVVLSTDVKERLKLYALGRGLVSAEIDQEAITTRPIGTVVLLTDADLDTG